MRRLALNASSLAVVAILLVLLSVFDAAQAQSGRRLPKGSAPPTPAPAEPDKKPAQPKTPVEPQMRLIVMSDISQNLNFSIPFPERVQTWVVKRLRDSQALEVMEGDRANRSEAVKRAKASTETIIIFLHMEESGFRPAMSRPGRSNLDDVTISYSVFAPVTGKSKSSGVIYLDQRNTMTSIGRGRTLPVCYPGVRGNDYILLQASLEIASRIMSALNVSAPPECS